VTDHAERQDARVSGGTDKPLDTAGLARSILDNAHEAFISMDARGIIIDWNREAERTFGWSRDEALGRELARTIVPERYRKAHWAGVSRFLDTRQVSIIGKRLELSALHRQGHEFPVEMTVSFATLQTAEAEQVTLYAFLHDISVRKFSEQVLVAMQSLTQAMARADSPKLALEGLLATLGTDMHWDAGSYWTLEPDGTLRRLASWRAMGDAGREFQDAGAQLVLAPGEGLPGHTIERGQAVWFRDITAEADFPLTEAAIQAGLHAAIGVPVTRGQQLIGALELLAVEPRALDRSLAAALVSVGEQVGELLGILEDRQALLARLERLALTDQLTGLPNRRAWEEGLRRELARAERDGHPVCVAVLDLDQFKRFNDEHGHQAGDALLKEAAEEWLSQLRAGDILARYGGEEFAAVIPAWPMEVVIMVVERLRAVMPAGQTCSAGVARWDGTEPAERLFARADSALYQAKQAGRNRTVSAG
jgi:diguanylate cyclase (GGDEF)-like protein/PAS domain S-box-containing protein